LDAKQVALEKNYCTYCLPVGSFLGLISSLLNAAKNNSIGEAEYECGPVKIIGSYCSL
jgi:hypothetical protein